MCIAFVCDLMLVCGIYLQIFNSWSLEDIFQLSRPQILGYLSEFLQLLVKHRAIAHRTILRHHLREGRRVHALELLCARTLEHLSDERPKELAPCLVCLPIK